MPSDKVEDHGAAAVVRLPGYNRDAPNWVKLLNALAGEVQELEDVMEDFLTSRAISTAVGEQLDGLGQILNRARESAETDSDYREALSTHYATLFRSGEPQTLIDVYKFVTEAVQVQLQEIFPATVQLTAFADAEVPPVIDAHTIALMETVKAAGVELILQYAVFDMFTLARKSEADGDDNGPSSTTNGFGSKVPANTDGGKLARTISP